jgi:ubiquinol-cytochrome c reductase cytochrome b subunit
MKNKIKIYHPLLKSSFNMLVDLPAPTSISYIWNWGSLLGITLIIQLLRGLLLASHYNSRIELAFSSVIHIIRDVKIGWFLRILHINGASLFFVLIYIHIRRGILFSSFKNFPIWLSGTLVLLILIGTAFMGYVLPWGQISFWGATVITNLVSAIPIMGKIIVEWLWGGFSVGGATLNRFFILHFLLPFILRALILIHLISLHITGSNSPTGLNPNLDKITFHPYFLVKDTNSIILYISILIFFTILFPYSIGDPENFNPANSLRTPIHIQPEWYYLFAYAILRSIPNKLGGVIALLISILVILILPFKKIYLISSKFVPIKKIFFWILASSFFILTWIGANPVEHPFEIIGQITTIIYFSCIFSLCFLFLFWKQIKDLKI